MILSNVANFEPLLPYGGWGAHGRVPPIGGAPSHCRDDLTVMTAAPAVCGHGRVQLHGGSSVTLSVFETLTAGVFSTDESDCTGVFSTDECALPPLS